MEIRNSDWIETLAKIFSENYLSYGKIIALTALWGGHEGQGCAQGVGHAPCLVPPSGTVSRGFSFPYSLNIPKIIFVRFYPVWTPFDMDILRNKKHATNRNWHWALDQYVSPKNNTKSCQKVYES